MALPKNCNLVFLPGLDGTGLSAEPLIKVIPADAAVAIVRYPTDKLLSFEETVESAAEQFPAGIAPVVVAESFSGPVAIKLIASGRVRAKFLILCATFARAPHPLLLKLSRSLGVTSLLKPEMPELFYKVFLGREFAASLAPVWRRVHAAVPARILDHRLGIISRVDVTAWLGKLLIPCLYLQATEDRVVPSSCLSPFIKYIPDLEIRKIKGPHFILQAQPRACITAIAEFLERHDLE